MEFTFDMGGAIVLWSVIGGSATGLFLIGILIALAHVLGDRSSAKERREGKHCGASPRCTRSRIYWA